MKVGQTMLVRGGAVLLCYGALSLLFVPAHAVPQVASVRQDSSSCRRFVQQFYDWYLPAAMQTGVDGRPADIALQRKAGLFNPALVRALRIDSEAQTRAKGELVGIDFDPFTGSQDPADHYEARRVTSQADKCSVEVWRASPRDTAAKLDKPEVVADVALVRGHWEFQNFRYPAFGGDLVSVLAELREERRKN